MPSPNSPAASSDRLAGSGVLVVAVVRSAVMAGRGGEDAGGGPSRCSPEKRKKLVFIELLCSPLFKKQETRGLCCVRQAEEDVKTGLTVVRAGASRDAIRQGIAYKDKKSRHDAK